MNRKSWGGLKLQPVTEHTVSEKFDENGDPVSAICEIERLLWRLSRCPDECKRVYRLASVNGRIDISLLVRDGLPRRSAEECLEILLGLGLLREISGAFTPLQPGTAMSVLTSPIEAGLQAGRVRFERTRDNLLTDLTAFRELAERFDPPQAEILSSPEWVARLVMAESQRCEYEMIGIRAPTLSSDLAQPNISRCLSIMLGRGVNLRAVFPHAATGNPVARARMERMQASGAVIRTSDYVPGHLVIFDRSVALIVAYDSEFKGAVVIREPTTAGYLYAIFESVWRQSIPFSNIDEPLSDYHRRITETESFILKQLADGYKDEAIARLVGISVRTCRTHIARIIKNLDANGRFQAGVKAAQSGVLERQVTAPNTSRAKVS
jgi:DNA-binding CsgD family transcriptional regulator